MLRPLWLLPLVLAGCTSDEKYIIVTVNARPAVHDVAMLRVTLSNAGSTRAEEIPVGSVELPATFSISPEDRVGELGIDIEAFDEDGGLIGRGAAQSTIETPAAQVLIEPTDFVVNTEYADDQDLSNYFDTAGLQLTATPGGTWTSVYTAACSTPCNVFGRRFDPSARPVSSVIAAGTLGFPLSTKLTTSWSTPTVASNAQTTLALWNHKDPVVASTYSIDCHALDASGASTSSSQRTISTDELPTSVAATALPSGNFGVVWDGRVTNSVIRAAIVRPDCTPLGPVTAVSTNVAAQFPGRSHLAANNTHILYAWTLSNTVHVRVGRFDGSFATADIELIAKTATEQVEFVRVAPLGTGFAVVVRWALITGSTGPGRLELHRVSIMGTLMGPPTLVSDRSGTDFASSQSFGVAARDTGDLLVVWHSCMEKGDGSGCGVFGRLFRGTGEAAGPEFPLATTTANDQTGPSAVALPGDAFAVAWTDLSGAPPDMSGSAVRARIIYPGAGGGAAAAPAP
jgi:hypothetical protein